MKLPNIFRSKLVILVLAVILVGLMMLQYRQWFERWSINREIRALQKQETELQQKNQELAQSLQYLTSKTYKEQLAREQLGLQKAGEIAVRFPSKGDQVSSSPEPAHQATSNPSKWWSYLFLK